MWQKTYPTLATVQQAGFETICTWCDELPPPQTGGGRTVMRRLRVERDRRMVSEVRKYSPDIADKMTKIGDLMGKLGMKHPWQNTGGV